jgi:ubiquinone/menaquinone biosynthesis C-methylase UbiE
MTDYDPIAEQYKRSKLQPWRTYIEFFTLMQLVGDLKDKTVLDVACGEGFYTRTLRQRGAAKVTGIDLSPKMIELARSSETRDPLGIEYIVGDGRDMNFGPVYDLAVAAYFLNYAHNRAELDAMCSAVARCLKPGGRFVTVNTNPACDFSAAPSYRKYGFETSVVGTFGEEAPITLTFYLDDATFQIENYYLNIKTHEAALTNAGFRNIRWQGPLLSPEGEAANGRDYWSAFLNNPPISFLEASL